MVRIEAPLEEWDRLVGELHALGTLGAEELPDASPPALLAYFESRPARDDIRSLASPSRGIRVGEPRSVPAVDWETRWREGLAPRRVAGLWVRPSWCEPAGEPEIRIDPGRAFGSGEHASTRLALELLLGESRPGESVLDVGTGTGILALAALRAGARFALGLDRDPVACESARENARRNGLGLSLLCGTLDAVAPEARFDSVVANLLAGELEPWLDRLASHARGRLILSGYLESQREGILSRMHGLGLEVLSEGSEEQSGERWCACALAHACSLQ